MTATRSITASHGFLAWLASLGGSLALTTYETGKLLFISNDAGQAIALFERDFSRPMGLAVGKDGGSFALATQFQIHRFNDVMTDRQDSPSFDARYVPHVSWVTGSVDAHDVGLDDDHRPVFVNTLYSCVAAVSDRGNFRPIWQPPFISALVAEDRCHLNGMAMADGKPRYVTAVAQSDSKDGWRNHRTEGGVVIDVETSEIVAGALSMPHSPRLHDGRLWVLNSGAGEFGYLDRDEGRFHAVAFCPGYARGLAFAGHHAVVGLSAPRKNGAFEGLALDAALARRKMQPFCGLLVIDLRTGKVAEWLRFQAGVQELYDVAFLPDVKRPSAVGFKTDEIKKTISMEA